MSKLAKASNGQAAARSSVTRARAAADAFASVRAEGLDPKDAKPLLAAWSRGELTDAQLDKLGRQLTTDSGLTAKELLATLHAA